MSLTFQQLPARSEKTQSLVVLLHGFASNGADILGLGKRLSLALPNTSFLAPDAPDPAPGRPGGRMWYTIPELDGSDPQEADAHLQASARRLDAFLDEQLARHELPARSLALMGFSQGAGLAYEVAPRRSETLAGVIAVAGRMKRKETLTQEIRSRPPFLILTGAKDQLLTAHDLNATASVMADAGIPALRVSMSNTGHALSDDGIATAAHFLKTVLNPEPIA